MSRYLKSTVSHILIHREELETYLAYLNNLIPVSNYRHYDVLWTVDVEARKILDKRYTALKRS